MDKKRPQMRRRLTQDERSKATRGRILDATLDCLMNLGLHQTSTVEVAKCAGVSRGALLHHYPSKIFLLQEALRHLLSEEIREVQRMASGFADGRLTLDDILDALWEHFSGRLFMITIEYIAAARTNGAICQTLTTVGLEFNNSLDAIWDSLPGNQGLTVENRRLALNATLCFLRGMGTQSVWRNDPELFREMLSLWKQVLVQVGVIDDCEASLQPTAGRKRGEE